MKLTSARPCSTFAVLPCGVDRSAWRNPRGHRPQRRMLAGGPLLGAAATRRPSPNGPGSA